MKSIQDLQIRSIAPIDLKNIAILHRKAFKDSALTKLGPEPVRRYYEWLLNGPHDCYGIGAFDGDSTLMGFCFSGVFRGSLSGFLEKNKGFLILWLLTHPWLVANTLIIERIMLALKVFNKKHIPKLPNLIYMSNSFGILSIAVDPDKQGMGIGTTIMHSIEEEALKKGYSQLHLTVHTENVGAVAFYESCGWEKINIEPGSWSGFMIKPLLTKIIKIK